MKTKHKLLFQDARNLSNIDSTSIDLIVTSPPYPMIQMWDGIFSKMNPAIKAAIDNENGNLAFELMHKELDDVWRESYRVLKFGGIACINIGDSTRTIGGKFQLFPNHSRIVKSFFDIGFHCLPEILWRKQTNAPNKFMGSGMLPVGAYVTLEHEYILIFRKDGKKNFNTPTEKSKRRESAFFWEERNKWFSDLWDGVKGINQKNHEAETDRRNAAYPLDIPYRLINMFSMKGDLVLDPYLGTGTTTVAAALSERNSIGVEIDKKFKNIISLNINKSVAGSEKILLNRIENHLKFVKERMDKKGDNSFKYINQKYNFPVIAKQEQDIIFRTISNISRKEKDLEYEISYKEMPPL